ncbi:hypothetical protein K7X08_025210 [Anisodus acutangulus]|uniref:RNase III domain-containing protein n=1 Tax=Anisodus acutangulus TaxID=402998 RepID=A0A9Q1MBB1_9SOLA|nr:hypothetical protein K7X08_025210 [Anisodus acutangulus]
MVADINNVNNEPNALRVSSSPDIMETQTQKPVEITSSAKVQEYHIAEDEVMYVPSSLPIDKSYLYSLIQSFINVLPEYPLHSHGLINAPKVFADVVESTIGAVFIDSNSSIDTTLEVAKALLDSIITPKMLQKNPVKKLYKTCQKHKLTVRVVDMWSHDGSFIVFTDNQLSGKGPEGSTTVKAADSGRLADGNSPGLSSISVDKSV